MTNPTRFKCNGCKRDTEFLWLDATEMPDGFKLYQCMDCGCVGVKNIVEAKDVDDSDVVRCDDCAAWKFKDVSCYTCQLIGEYDANI